MATRLQSHPSGPGRLQNEANWVDHFLQLPFALIVLVNAPITARIYPVTHSPSKTCAVFELPKLDSVGIFSGAQRVYTNQRVFLHFDDNLRGKKATNSWSFDDCLTAEECRISGSRVVAFACVVFLVPRDALNRSSLIFICSNWGHWFVDVFL